MIAWTIALLALPAMAQGQKGEEPAYARKVLREYAECTVQVERDLARKYVLMPADERMDGDAFRRVTNPRCLGFLEGKLRMSGQQYRGALAQRLIEVEFKGRGAIDPAQSPALDWSVPTPAQKNYEQRLAESFVNRLGECVIRRDAAGVHRVLMSRPGEPDELDAFRAIGPAIPPCVPRGEKLSLNRPTLRDALAISYYRLAVAETGQ